MEADVLLASHSLPQLLRVKDYRQLNEVIHTLGAR
jgi:hypothetical protein